MRGGTGFVAIMPDGGRHHRALRITSWEEPGFGSITLPVGPQGLQQLRRKHYLAIFVAFALTDPDYLALTVDIRDPQVDELGNPQPGGIDGHQDRAMFKVRRALEECGYFGGAQDHRQLLLVPGIRNIFDHPVPMQDVVVEKTQRAYGLVE